MCAINTATELLEMMRLGLYMIEVKSSVLMFSPAFAIYDQMADLIRTHKVGLIKILESEIL